MKLNLGCNTKKLPGYVNIDIDPAFEPDLVCDVVQGLPYDDNTVGEVRAFDFLEHIPLGKTMGVINDIWRVLKPGGVFEHSTPSTDSRAAFQDPTHLSFWNKNSWLYFTHDGYRAIYNIPAKFEIGLLEDVVTGEHIIHTHGRLYAVK